MSRTRFYDRYFRSAEAAEIVGAEVGRRMYAGKPRWVRNLGAVLFLCTCTSVLVLTIWSSWASEGVAGIIVVVGLGVAASARRAAYMKWRSRKSAGMDSRVTDSDVQ